jgi:hypothetical protein
MTRDKQRNSSATFFMFFPMFPGYQMEFRGMVSHTIHSGSYCFVFRALYWINRTHSAVCAHHIDPIKLYIMAPQINHIIHLKHFSSTLPRNNKNGKT